MGLLVPIVGTLPLAGPLTAVQRARLSVEVRRHKILLHLLAASTEGTAALMLLEGMGRLGLRHRWSDALLYRRSSHSLLGESDIAVSGLVE